ncbi:hypothetical protein EAF00_008838 [Botryotinia globosa]|nr:hypothetical protein EAF00_008838 [Botryotinia globosa]
MSVNPEARKDPNSNRVKIHVPHIAIGNVLRVGKFYKVNEESLKTHLLILILIELAASQDNMYV